MNKKSLLVFMAIHTFSALNSAHNYELAISFEDPAMHIQPASSKDIYFFTTSRISDADQVTTWLTSNLADYKKISDLKNLCETFDPDNHTFKVNVANHTIEIFLETKCKVLTKKQLLAITKKKCQQQELKKFLTNNAQIIITCSTLERLGQILRDPKIKCTCPLET